MLSPEPPTPFRARRRSADGPGARRHDRSVSDRAAACLAQARLVGVVEAGEELARRADRERVRLPPLVEARVRDRGGERRLLDAGEPCRREQLDEMALARARQPRLVLGARMQLARRVPERAQRALAAGVVPDARGDDAARLRHACHLAMPATGSAMKWTTSCAIAASNSSSRTAALGGSAPHVDPRMRSRAASTNGSDGSTAARRPAEAAHELGRERARPAADVENSLPAGDAREVARAATRAAPSTAP